MTLQPATRLAISVAAEALHAEATALVLQDRDAEARECFLKAAAIYEAGGCAELAEQERDLAMLVEG